MLTWQTWRLLEDREFAKSLRPRQLRKDGLSDWFEVTHVEDDWCTNAAQCTLGRSGFKGAGGLKIKPDRPTIKACQENATASVLRISDAGLRSLAGQKMPQNITNAFTTTKTKRAMPSPVFTIMTTWLVIVVVFCFSCS